MTNAATATHHRLTNCPTCGREISTDADACPGCGAENTWVHPTLRAIMDHVGKLDRETRYECRGHRLHLTATSQNARQSIGSFLMVAAMVLLVLGFFVPLLIGLAVFMICLGGLLTLFGLSAFTRHELSIDLREADPIIGLHDQEFWADVIRIVRQAQAGTAGK
jgi:hypothetical protein